MVRGVKASVFVEIDGIDYLQTHSTFRDDCTERKQFINIYSRHLRDVSLIHPAALDRPLLHSEEISLGCGTQQQ